MAALNWQAWLFPENGTCPICGRILLRQKVFLCSRCAEDLPYNQAETCVHCGRGIIVDHAEKAGEWICSDCQAERDIIFSGGLSWLEYQQGTKRLIAGMKFEGRQALCGWVGEQMAWKLMEQPWLSTIDWIVPVPLHVQRLEERGYNQSALIVKGMVSVLAENGVALLPQDALIRQVPTPHQVGLSQEMRLENLRGAFSVEQPKAVEGKRILLVDDVMTTGATLRECGQTLLSAGALAVYVATAAAKV